MVLDEIRRRALFSDILNEVDVILQNIFLILVILHLTLPFMQLSDVLEVYLLLLLQILIDIDNVAVDLLGESVARLGIQLETLINGISDVFLVFTQHVYDLTLLQLFVLSILVQQVFGNLGEPSLG